MPGTGGQHRKTEARFIQVKRKPFLPPDDSGFLREMSCKLKTAYPVTTRRDKSLPLRVLPLKKGDYRGRSSPLKKGVATQEPGD